MNFYHIDAFASELFKGNPAGVCILGDSWLPDELMQNIAFENNLSETAFLIHRDNEYHIRWFTPTVEVDLCGHATFATFYALVTHEGYTENSITFKSLKGDLRAYRKGSIITIDLPAEVLKPVEYSWEFECFNVHPTEVYRASNDYLFVFENEAQISGIEFDLDNISKVDSEGIVITAAGNELDFVSRFFAPNVGIPEDPVTGSAHTLLVPYWSKRLNKMSLEAAQLSKRSGRLSCVLDNDRVLLSGHGATFIRGQLML